MVGAWRRTPEFASFVPLRFTHLQSRLRGTTKNDKSGGSAGCRLRASESGGRFRPWKLNRATKEI